MITGSYTGQQETAVQECAEPRLQEPNVKLKHHKDQFLGAEKLVKELPIKLVIETAITVLSKDPNPIFSGFSPHERIV